MDQLDSGIAVHSTNMRTNKEPFRMIQAHRFFNQPAPKNVWITLHNAHPLVKQGHRKLHQTKKARWIMVCTVAPAYIYLVAM